MLAIIFRAPEIVSGAMLPTLISFIGWVLGPERLPTFIVISKLA
jgi:hypothetical protein